jgi:hypothetical protein
MLIIVVILTPAVLIIGSALRVYFKFRGTGLITCPETKNYAAVAFDSKRAALIRNPRRLGLRYAGVL